VIDALHRELGAVGIRGRLRRRILEEFADHLACDPQAELGEPRELARQFADELGTSRSRGAAFTAFAALAFAGCLYSVSFVAYRHVATMHARTPLLGGLAGALVVLAPQLAFVSGSLALLRAFRRRREPVLAGAEVRVIVRRTGLALASGLATMAGLGLLVYEYGPHVQGWVRLLGYVAAGAGGLALVAAAPPLVAAARVHASAPGAAGDVFDDLGPLVPARLRGRPWKLALAVSGAIFLGVALAGVLQSDPFDGALRGIADGLACLVGFAVLGRFLGLRGR
jgi:hypothetical protein